MVWGPPAEVERPLFYQLVRPRIGETVSTVIISETLLGCYQHYDGSNTIPCVGRDQGCLPCAAGMNWRWYGYFGVYLPWNGKLGILQITRGAYDTCPAVQGTNVPFRGHYLKAWRRGRSVNSPLSIELGKRIDPKGLPPEFDVKGALLRLWGIRGGASPGDA